MGYWLSMRSTWIVFSNVLFFHVSGPTEAKLASINTQYAKKMRPVSSHLDWTDVVNKGFITWLLFRLQENFSYRTSHLWAAKEKQNGFCWYIVTNKVTLWSSSYSACLVYTKTIIPLSVSESGGSIFTEPRNGEENIHHYSPPPRWKIVKYDTNFQQKCC